MDGQLAIEKSANAEPPMAKSFNCLLTVDVWEHAYYLDYQNARSKYLEGVLGKILNWDFAAQNLTKQDKAFRAAAGNVHHRAQQLQGMGLGPTSSTRCREKSVRSMKAHFMMRKFAPFPFKRGKRTG